MTGHYPWEDLIKTWSPERRAAIEAEADKTYAEILRQRERAKTEPEPVRPSVKPALPPSRTFSPTR